VPRFARRQRGLNRAAASDLAEQQQGEGDSREGRDDVQHHHRRRAAVPRQQAEQQLCDQRAQQDDRKNDPARPGEKARGSGLAKTGHGAIMRPAGSHSDVPL
jgi:hypothetical protein